MRLQLISDVHTEFHADHGRSFIDGLDPAGVDVLVVAGDLTVHDYLADNLERLCARFPEVVYVTGNHEYYRAEPELLKDTLRDLVTRLGHFCWLENKMVKIGEQRFLGCTLWFPYDEENDCYERLMNDFRLIPRFKRWVYDANAESVAWLHEHVRPGDVVVTHHIPDERGVHPKFRTGRDAFLNRFFLCQLPRELLARPSLWLFGHTHEAMDFRIGDCRFICHPMGYLGVETNGEYSPRTLSVNEK